MNYIAILPCICSIVFICMFVCFFFFLKGPAAVASIASIQSTRTQISPSTESGCKFDRDNDGSGGEDSAGDNSGDDSAGDYRNASMLKFFINND